MHSSGPYATALYHGLLLTAACQDKSAAFVSVTIDANIAALEFLETYRMPTYPRDRFGYSSPFTRPPLKLPGKGRMIVWSVVNIEEWEITRPMARQLSIAPQGPERHPRHAELDLVRVRHARRHSGG